MSISTRQWRAMGRRVPILGDELFVIDTGERERPAIFLIHGFPTSSWDWAPIWDELHHTHRLIALDLLGFGFSDKPNRPYSIIEQADRCEAVATLCGLETFHVLAHDYGDTVAQELLARQNEGRGVGRWSSLTLLNGGLFPETHQPRPIQRLLLSPLGPLVGRLTTRGAFERAFGAVFGPETPPSADEMEGFWSVMKERGGRRIAHRLIRYMVDRKQHRERWVAALREATVPVLLVDGLADPVSGAHMVRRYRDLMSDRVGKGHTVVELPGIGHYPQVEAPAQVLRAVREHLATVPEKA